MIEDWYRVEGTTRFEERDIEIVSLELLVKATCIEDACQKARKFLEQQQNLIRLNVNGRINKLRQKLPQFFYLY